jgi:hypothetical protein
MRLVIDGILHTFTPIRAFRSAHNLPPDFGVNVFEPKQYAGLGRIDEAGSELQSVRQAMLEALPAPMPLSGWLTAVDSLQSCFTNELYRINAVVGLRPVEIEFAAAGFGDVCRAFVYALMRDALAWVRSGRTLTDMPPPDFTHVYNAWLSSTARISQTVHPYTHNGESWHVQIVNHAYGRAGLIVAMPNTTAYISDSTLGCPAEGYMASLLADVTAGIAARVTP